MLNVCSMSLRGIAPRVQWPFIVRTTRNAVVAIKYLEVNSVFGGMREYSRCNVIVANKCSVEDSPSFTPWTAYVV